MGISWLRVGYISVKSKENFLIKKPIQPSIPLEVSDNYEEESDFENENELVKEDSRHPTRVAAKNANLFRYLQKRWWKS